MSAAFGVALRDPLPWHDLTQIASVAEDLGAQAIFVPEVGGREAFSQLTGLAAVTSRVQLGTGVVPLGERSGRVLAMAGATLHDISGGRAIVGLGAGAPRKGALAETCAMAEFLRRAFTGEEVTPPDDDEPFQLLLDLERPPPIWLAALGPKMVALAGEVADGVLLNWCTPERVAEAAASVRRSAEDAGRDPADITIAVYIRACIEPDRELAMDALLDAAAGYVAQPGYAAQFEAMGLDPSDPRNVIVGVAIAGDATEGRARLQAYREAGADLPMIYPVPALDPRSSIEGTLRGLASQAEFGG